MHKTADFASRRIKSVPDHLNTYDQIKKIFPGFDGTVIVDGTHVEACWPQDKEERKAAYSGKKKTTTYIYVNPTGSFPIFASSLSPYVRHLSS